VSSRELVAWAEQELARQQAPGVALAVAAQDEIVLEAGFGQRDAEAGLPATPDTVFGIASVAKPFTALAVLQLAQRGALSVEQPVRAWLPHFRLPAGSPDSGAVTLHHLLTHTGGLPPEVALPYARAPDMLGDPDLDRFGLSERQRRRLTFLEQSGRLVDSYDGLIERLAEADAPPLGPPGRYFSYSGEGYALLAAVVERVSGQPFPEYVHEHVLEPLGLDGTGFRPGTSDRIAATHPAAQLYATAPVDGVPTRFPSPAWWASGRVHGHANMVSTARDLARFGAVLAGGGALGDRRVAAPETIARMLAPHAPLPTGGFYGYGLFVYPDHGGAGSGVTLVTHAGGGKGAGAQLVLALPHGVAAAALANLSSSPLPRQVAFRAVRAFAGLPAEQKPSYPDYPQDPAHLARLAGTYRWNDGEDGARFVVADDGLRVHLPGGRVLPCRPVAEDGVVVDGAEAPLRFLLGADGRAWALFDGARIARKAAREDPAQPS
jgi:CubicO group peptidase (beta-lactamase class C family)